nr:RNA-directed DNA polymerase [uncultured Lachnoclostridium sp.]
MIDLIFGKEINTKRYCKNIDITHIQFLKICAADCLKKKWKRRDTIEFFAKLTGTNKEHIRDMIRRGDKDLLINVAASYMRDSLVNHDLHFVPIWYKTKVDESSKKVRRIGIQHVSQQLFDYVAVYSMSDLMKRIGEYQCASIPGRGPMYGMKHIRKWLKNRRIKYVAQLDVQKCFPSIPQDKLFAMIDKYVSNPEIRWLVHELVNTFETGLSIGSYLSQYLCNLYMSQLYHEISERMFITRRNKRINYVEHVLFYMDDILLLGCNSKLMHRCIKEIIEYTRDKLGLTIKPSWKMSQLKDNDFIDTMGFRIYRDHITMRRRIFLRARRAYVRAAKHGIPTAKQAKKCMSYYGNLINTNSAKLIRKYKVVKISKQSRKVVSHESKIRCSTA